MVSEDQFEKHLKYLKKHNTVLSLDEVVDARANGDKLPTNSAVITIDDGYGDAYQIAYPLLEKYKMPATLYVITDVLDRKIWLWTDLMRFVLLKTSRDKIEINFPNGKKVHSKLTNRIQRFKVAARINSFLKKQPEKEKGNRINEIADQLLVEIPKSPTKDFALATWSNVLEMDKGVIDVGSHTVTHPILPKVDKNQLAYELTTAKARLEKKLKRNVEHFCYPNGSLDKSVRTAVARAGYKSAVTTKYGLVDDQDHPLALNRIDAAANIENFAQSVSGFEYVRMRINL